MLFLILACQHPTSPRSAGDEPILPAPEAPVYATGPSRPRDALVASVSRDLPWEEALSGAAGSLALGGHAPTSLGETQWAAWRAGYPYAVRSLSFAEAAPGQIPAGLVEQLSGQLRPDDQVGLARARVGSRDVWVGLIAHRSVPLAPFARELALGATLTVQPEGAATWTLVSPTGALTRGAAPLQQPLGEAGEWFVELRDPSGALLVGAPVYVGLPAPPDPPLALPGVAPQGEGEALAQAHEGLNSARAIFDLGDVSPDDNLDHLLGASLQAALDGRWDAAAAADRLRAAGYEARVATCKASTVPLCLDSLLRSAEGRAALLVPDARYGGLAAQVSTAGVTLVVGLADE